MNKFVINSEQWIIRQGSNAFWHLKSQKLKEMMKWRKKMRRAYFCKLQTYIFFKAIACRHSGHELYSKYLFVSILFRLLLRGCRYLLELPPCIIIEDVINFISFIFRSLWHFIHTYTTLCSIKKDRIFPVTNLMKFWVFSKLFDGQNY